MYIYYIPAFSTQLAPPTFLPSLHSHSRGREQLAQKPLGIRDMSHSYFVSPTQHNAYTRHEGVSGHKGLNGNLIRTLEHWVLPPAHLSFKLVL
jgi:hypothetical protein